MLSCSALTGDGVAEIWQMVMEHREQIGSSGHLQARRSAQAVDWIREVVTIGLERRFRSDPAVAERLPALEAAVLNGQMTSFAAARDLLALRGSNDGSER